MAPRTAAAPARRSRGVQRVRARLSSSLGPEQSGGADEQHRDHDHIDRQHLELWKHDDRDRADEPDHQRARERAAHRAEPADHHHRKRLDHELDRHVEGRCSGGYDKCAGRRAEDGAGGEDQRIDAPHVDAERLRHGAVLGGGAQDAPVVGALQESADADGCEDGGGNHQQIVDGNAEVPGADRAVDQVAAVERARIGAPEETEHVLEHEQEREGEQQLKAFIAPIDAAQ